MNESELRVRAVRVPAKEPAQARVSGDKAQPVALEVESRSSVPFARVEAGQQFLVGSEWQVGREQPDVNGRRSQGRRIDFGQYLMRIQGSPCGLFSAIASRPAAAFGVQRLSLSSATFGVSQRSHDARRRSRARQRRFERAFMMRAAQQRSDAHRKPLADTTSGSSTQVTLSHDTKPLLREKGRSDRAGRVREMLIYSGQAGWPRLAPPGTIDA